MQDVQAVQGTMVVDAAVGGVVSDKGASKGAGGKQGWFSGGAVGGTVSNKGAGTGAGGQQGRFSGGAVRLQYVDFAHTS